ncbi:MAG: metallophosphatase family protein [Nitrososphaerales archaeon]|nr:metallophosphatase family protein [Nitrososphaerales archaeon]
MLRVAFVSDIHSNLEALDSVLGELRGEEVVCLGDVVGYGSNPNEVIETLRETGARTVLGNHDSAVLTGDTSMFNARAAMAARWTEAQLTPESKEFLKALPKEIRVDFGGVRTYLTHGSPDDNLWEYVDPSTHLDLFGHYLSKLGVRLIGFGHTHVPYVWSGENGTVFNPGSVGQPRDMDRRASFAVATFDRGSVDVEQRRVEYDYKGAAEKIVKAGLPASLAQRLSLGI